MLITISSSNIHNTRGLVIPGLRIPIPGLQVYIAPMVASHLRGPIGCHIILIISLVHHHFWLNPAFIQHHFFYSFFFWSRYGPLINSIHFRFLHMNEWGALSACLGMSRSDSSEMFQDYLIMQHVTFKRHKRRLVYFQYIHMNVTKSGVIGVVRTLFDLRLG